MKERMKASDVYRESKSLLPKTASFSDVFPEIKDLSIEIEQDSFHNKKLDTIKSFYDIKNPPGPFIDCDNPFCYNGGFNIGNILKYMIVRKETEEENTISCQGYEGSPKGRRKDDDCLNQFNYKIKIKYKN